MIARKPIAATLAVLCVLVGALALGGAPASAALQATYQRQLTGFGRLQDDSVAVNETSGDLYVADSSDGKVIEFNAAGVKLATWEGSSVTNTPGAPAGSFGGGKVAVAVNDATGEVYVTDKMNSAVDILSAEGAYLSQFNGKETPAKAFGSLGPEGAVVDQATGEVYVPDPSHNVVDVFDSSGKYLSQIAVRTIDKEAGCCGAFGTEVSVAIDDLTGDVLVAQRMYGGSNLPGVIEEFNAAGQPLGSWAGWNTPAGFGTLMTVAVDESTGDALVATVGDPELGKHEYRLQTPVPSVVDVFDAQGDYLSPQITGTPEGAFTRGINAQDEFAPHRPYGVTVDSDTGEIYVSEGNAVDIYSSTVVPGVIPGVVSSVQPTGTALTLNGTVNPDGVPVSGCQFEYVPVSAYDPAASDPYEAGGKADCGQAAGGGRSDVAVSAGLSSLQPDTLYHFRLNASNANGANLGEDATFFTSTAPLIEEENTLAVGSVTASIGAHIDATGQPSSYRVEYGTSTEYGSSTPEVALGNSESATPVMVQLTGLQPGVEYHYRFVAANALGTTVDSEDASFTTYRSGASSSTLPDGRFYELVTDDENEDNDVYTPQGGLETTASDRPPQTATNGAKLAYAADPAPGGNGAQGNPFGDEFLASRAPTGGWSSSAITPTGVGLHSGIYAGFSSDLSIGLVTAQHNEPLTSDASPNCKTLYARTSDGQYHALFTKTKNAAEHCQGEGYAPRLTGVAENDSQVAFEMGAALTAEAPVLAEAGQQDLYDYEMATGQLNVVNVLPDGTPVANAAFGSPNNGMYVKSHVISADGSRMFWTDLNDGDLYVRENGGTSQARTVLISEGGEYWTASADGSLAFFTKGGDLYSFDVNSEQATDLAPGGEVQGVVGASEDGAYVYFVGKAALKDAGGESLKNARNEAPAAGQENLYVYHEGTTRFITTLAESDSTDWFTSAWGGEEGEGIQGSVTAEVSADGRSVAFQSTKSLTGYDNFGVVSYTNDGEPRTAYVNEVFVYQTDTGQLSCASCSPSGEPPVAGYGGYLPPELSSWINAEGNEVFFESEEPLVPQDKAGVSEAYEWERDGSGSCDQVEGCLYLLSAGTGNKESHLLGASASGDDVFFAARAQLVLEDQGDDNVIYDARRGSRPLAKSQCTGTGCQGVPPAPPIFATPSSVTFNGVGNFEGPPPAESVKAKKKTAAQVKASDLAKALKACKTEAKRKTKAKARRKACEAAARKRYGAKPKATKERK